jgi:serine protease Do
MDDILLLDAVERYIRGEMNPDERLGFENLRKKNTEIDQLVVEHTLFLQQMNRFGEWHKFKSTLQDVHTSLAQQGKIDSARLTGKAKVVYLWKRYKRLSAIAAIIAGVTALTVSAMVYVLSPKADNYSLKIQELGRDIQTYKHQQNILGTEVNTLKTKISEQQIPFKAGGSGFLIDGRGYLITNAHIIRNSKNIVVMNSRNDQFRARVVQIDLSKDLAILKIDDDSFKTLSALPYSIRKSSTEVAEPIYTLGYPRNEIVYSEGYLSAKTGFNGDTLSCQLGIAANRGNSGGPVFNHDGEIIGVLSTKETEAEGVAFAIQSKYIFDAVEELRKDTTYQSLHLPLKSTLKGLDKSLQFKKVQDYIFMVKGD